MILLENLLYSLERDPITFVIVIAITVLVVKLTGKQNDKQPAVSTATIDTGSFVGPFERGKQMRFWDFYNNSAWR